MQQVKICPYLLRNTVITAPNQAWSISITYIPIRHVFLYLTAEINWNSRCIVGWEVDNALDTRMISTPYERPSKLPNHISQIQIKVARAKIRRNIRTYNFERCRSALEYQTSA